MLFEKILIKVIKLSQSTPLRGMGGYSSEALKTKGSNGSKFPQAQKEAEQFLDFFAHFNVPDMMTWFKDKVILDLGCGYGGKTVEFVRTCHAKKVHGVEPFENMVELSREYAASLHVNNCQFRQCSQYEIPYDHETFDAVVSHDVLEHVADPRITVKEIYRVLRPGGKAFIIFPPYHGMMSHHLDYITKLPALHLIFSPDTIIKAVNKILASSEGSKFSTKTQPVPKLSYNGKRKCLPTLNGMTSREFMCMVNDFKILQLNQKPLFNRYKKNIFGKILLWFINTIRNLGDSPRDVFSSSLICIIEKK